MIKVRFIHTIYSFKMTVLAIAWKQKHFDVMKFKKENNRKTIFVIIVMDIGIEISK